MLGWVGGDSEALYWGAGGRFAVAENSIKEACSERETHTRKSLWYVTTG
jgi:hypothetical protein